MGLALVYKKSTATPQFSGNPSYSGSLLVGQTLTGSYSITNAVSSVTVSWMSYSTIEKFDGIERSTSAEYTILADDADRYLEFVVTATNNAGTTIGYSGLTPQVVDDVAPTPEFTVGATVAGQPKVGATLTANYTVTNADTVAFQWQSSADNITFGNVSAATNQTFVPTGDEQDDYLRVVITATNGSGSTVSTSASTGQVAAADAELPPPAGAPVSAIPLNATELSTRTLSDGAVLLNGDGAYYYCVGDMTFTGAAFVVNHRNITLDLNGCTVTYNTSGGESLWGSLTPPTPPYTDATYTADRYQGRNCKANFCGIWAPEQPGDSVYDGQGVVAAWNRNHGGFVLKNGTLQSLAGGDNTHAVSCHDTNGTWTISGVKVRAGTGRHARCVNGSLMDLRAYDSVFITCTRSWYANKDRERTPACIWCPSKDIVVERCAVVGGISGVYVGSNAIVRDTFISHYCFLTNGWGVIEQNKTGVLVEDCVILPYNGRGIYFDLDNSRSSTARNNVILTWEFRNSEFGDNLTASAFKFRHRASGHTVTGNNCLSVAGRRSGDASLPTWQGTYPITVASPTKRPSATAAWVEADGYDGLLLNNVYGNTLRSIYYGIVEDTNRQYQHASAISLTGASTSRGLSPDGTHDETYGNTCYSNWSMVVTNQSDGIGRHRGVNAGNSFTWETGVDAHAAFTAAADAKLATLGLSPMVQAIADEQKAVVYAALDDAINQSDAGLDAGRAFWATDFGGSSPTEEFATLTDPTLGSGVDATTYRVLATNRSHATSLRIARTHTTQILDGVTPVANATVTVTPDQIDGPFNDVTTTTTDANGNCTITYYESARTRAGGSTAALTLQTGTSSTIAVEGVGSASVAHASLGATVNIGA